MMNLAFIPIAFGILEFVLCASPEVECPAPISPQHGQAFMYQEGQVVKYVCEPGYKLMGKELVRCINGEWEDPNPACIEIGEDSIEDPEVTILDPHAPIPPVRTLFNWGSADDSEKQEEVNSTSDEAPLSDEARVRLLMYPQRRARIVTSTINTGRLQSATELEEEEKKRSQEGKSGESTTIHLESPPSMVYVRRTITPSKSEAQRKALDEQYKTASLHMTLENGHDVQVVSLPRAAVALNDKGELAEQTLRQMYWYAHHNYPRQSSLVEYRRGAPVVMTLTESQLAWVNSLHPDLRDQYLRDFYVMRAEEAAEGERAQAFLRRYGEAYNYMYHLPYLRQPVSLVMEDPISNYDYTCHESGYPFIKAPKLRNMHVARYDRRQNPNNPYNHYLSAVYRCDPGYVMRDTRFTELHCSKKDWIGVRPVCVRRS